MELRLVPVVELEPSDLGVSNFVELLHSGEWDMHWEARLAPFGIRPLRPGSWFVATGEFTSRATFNLLARVHLEWDPESGDPPPELDHLGAIIEACADAATLDRWLVRAVTGASAGEIFTEQG